MSTVMEWEELHSVALLIHDGTVHQKGNIGELGRLNRFGIFLEIEMTKSSDKSNNKS